jgi:hypothetical protein
LILKSARIIRQEIPFHFFLEYQAMHGYISVNNFRSPFVIPARTGLMACGAESRRHQYLGMY